jgi:serine/threonine-protein kinase
MSSRTLCPTTGMPIPTEAAGRSADAERTHERRPERPDARRERRPGGKAKPGSPQSLVGTIVDGKYLVHQAIGQGGMGTVYEAEHRSTGRRVAMKVLKPEHAAKPESVARLQQEARIVGQLHHPNITEVIDISQLRDGTHYLVMELLRGETLARRIEQRGALQPREMVHVAMQVLSALTAAHARGVVHRDMKPDNIFLTEKAGMLHAKILDFGISKATSPDEQPHHLTRTGMVMGTPYYMAPEQAMGERQLDGRVDVWGVGVMMYEALSGVRPFVAKNYNALLVQILTVQAAPLESLNPAVQPALAAVIRHALEKKRDQRFRTAEEFRTALEPFLHTGRTSPIRSFGASGLPRVTVFGSDDSSVGTTDEEPTQVIDRPSAEDDAALFGEGDKTEVDDPPSFQDSDHATTERHRKR